MAIATAQTYAKQKRAVEKAVKSFIGLRHNECVVLKDAQLTGNHLWVKDRGEYWFEVTYYWNTHHPNHNPRVETTTGWGHTFPDLAEFDRIVGSEDPESSFGFRHAMAVCAALAGEYSETESTEND